jgi:Xaa-Pro aminopeptidase
LIEELRERWRQAQTAMGEVGVDALLVGPSSDFAYLTAFAGHQSERLVLFCLPLLGTPHLLAPRFEAPRFETIGHVVDVSLWDDGDDPYLLLDRVLPKRRRNRIAVGAELFGRAVLRLAKELPASELLDGSDVLGPLRIRKSARELALLRAAAAAADATLDDVATEPLADESEQKAAAFVARRLLDNGHDEATHAIVAGGANGAIPHHRPTDARLAPGVAVVFDLGGVVGGYHSDVTRTALVGDAADPELRDVYQCVRAANEAGVAAAKPGAVAADVDSAARDVIRGAGYGDYFTHRTGHGVGLDVHEPPYIVAADVTPLEPGMVFSIEPGVYLPGKFGVRIEDIVAVGSDRAERLNRRAHDLIRLG